MRGKANLASRLLCVVFLLVFSLTAAAGGVNYGGGNGTATDPYLIYTAEQMNAIGADANDWDKHFKLMADIDLSQYKGTDFNTIGYASGWWASSENKYPFTGVFDGNDRTISNFNYGSSKRESYIGIFGYTERATVKNLYLIDPNINVDGGEHVGSLVGFFLYGTITACYVQGGNIWGASEVGGLVGNNYGTISECASLTEVLGGSRIGGLVGYNGYGTISNCYSFSNVTGISTVGGLVGICESQASILNSYSAGSVQGEENTGGLLGFTDQGEILHCFWDIEASGQISSAGGIGKTTAEMQTASTFVGWGPYAVWTINEGLDYPRLLWENMPGELITTSSFPSIEGSGTQDDPYLIYTGEQFNLIGLFPLEWDKHFKLMADIDLAGHTATKFNVVGSFALYPASGDIAFSGTFDGNGHTISNFSYTGISGGVFGWVKGAEIKNLTLIDPNVNSMPGGIHIGSLVGYLYDATVENCHVKGGQVSGGFRVGGLIGENYYGTITDCSFKGIVSNASGLGGLVGWNRGTITNSYFIGEVSGEGQEVGGLVGFNTDTINNCETSANVSGTRKVGGLVGTQTGGRITDCYAAGSVTGRDEVGGFIGGNNGIIDSCCTISDVTGQTDVGGFDGQNGLNLTDVVWGGRISNCYARSNVVGEENVGGLVGCNYGFGTINNCYSTGVVSGVTDEGGLVGQNEYGDVINSFWDIETSGLSTSAAGTGKTTAQMQDPNIYISSGWIFIEQRNGPNYNWAELVGGGYPILWWQLSPLPELPFFSGGTGKLNDPYLITTAEELNMIGHNPRLMNAHFKLVADIDLANADFFMIGNDSFPFSGVFDGNGKRIFNFCRTVQEISPNPIDENSVGLFKYILGGRIENLGIIDPNIDSLKSEWLGTLVSWLSEGKVTSCYVQGGSISGSDYVGGLVSKNFGIITNCHTDITVKGGYSVGGLIGDNIGDVSDCCSNSILLGERNTGGLVGNNSGQIFNCYSKGNVSASYIGGGLVGYNHYDGEIIRCYANGSVTGGNSIGGLVGYNNGFSTPAKISNCYADGIITGVDNVAGLVGYNKFGIISNCYSTSIVSGSDNIGGLVGRLGPGDVSQCYSTGMVSGTTDTGGLVGVQEGGSVYYSFWDVQTSQQSTSIGGVGKTTVEMQRADTFLDAGWDFVGETENGTEDIWWILEGQDYPHLWWEPTEDLLDDS